MKKCYLLLLFVIMNGCLYAQSKLSFQCTYMSSTKIPAEVRAMSDENMKQAVIAQLSQSTKAYYLLFSNGQYLFDTHDKGAVMSIGGSLVIYRNLNTNESVSQESILDKLFLIKESSPTYDWKITEEAADVAGMKCTKAILNGNDSIVAWFTYQIPLGVGPMGYMGLPGLIVCLETSSRTYMLSDIAYKDNIDITPPSSGKEITRDEFNKLQTKKMNEFGVGDGSAGKVHIIKM